VVRLVFGAGYDRLSGEEAKAIHDTRRAGNVAVESLGDTTFVYSGEIATRYLFDREPIDASLLAALGNPQAVVCFCHYDSGGSFGYRIIEDGEQTRFRLYYEWQTTEEGPPQDFEAAWLGAEPHFDAEEECLVYRHAVTGQTLAEGGLTAHLLAAAMAHFFQLVPWDTRNDKTQFKLYRKAAKREPAQPPSKTTWWKFW
jgi:hypothetical protein